MVNFLDVRPANSASPDAEQYLALAYFRYRHRLYDNAPFAPVDSGAHLTFGLVVRRVVQSDVCDCLAHDSIDCGTAEDFDSNTFARSDNSRM